MKPKATDPNARTHTYDRAALARFEVFLFASIATVLITRAYLAAAGYPQIGGGALHIAHVLWGGLLMAVAFVLLLSFAGPVVRPVGALVGGVGFGLFVDEVGKFVTSDNDYFYKPTAALIYVVIVALVLLGETLHGRFAPHPVEYVAGAADLTVAGLVGGFSAGARTEAHRLLDRAVEVERAQAAERAQRSARGDAVGVHPGRGLRGADEVRALVERVDEDSSELPNPIDVVGRAVVRATRRLVAARWVPWLTVGVLVATSLGSVARGLEAWWGGADVPGWIVVGLLLGAAVSTGFAVVGLVVVRRDRAAGYRLFRRAVLVSLLVTQVFVFRLQEWAATAGLLLDLAVLGLVAAELNQLAEAEAASAPQGDRRPGQPQTGDRGSGAGSSAARGLR
jgi:hypothetical protein